MYSTVLYCKLPGGGDDECANAGTATTCTRGKSRAGEAGAIDVASDSPLRRLVNPSWSRPQFVAYRPGWGFGSITEVCC